MLVTRKAIPINSAVDQATQTQTCSSHRSLHVVGPNCHAMVMSLHSCSLADQTMLYKYLVCFDRSLPPQTIKVKDRSKSSFSQLVHRPATDDT